MPIEIVLTGTTADPDAYRALAAQMCKTSEGEPGTLRYAWHLAPSGAVRNVDVYADSAALLSHVGTAQSNGTLDQYLQLVAVERVDVVGTPDAEARAVLEQFGAHFLEEVAAIPERG